MMLDPDDWRRMVDAPKDGTPVLLWTPLADDPIVGLWDADDKEWQEPRSGDDLGEPFAWMDLPGFPANWLP